MNIKLDLTGKTSYIYFIRIGETGPIKIGYSRRIKNRLITIQVDNPFLVFLIAFIEGDRNKEFDLHEKFKEDKILGEWFFPSENLLNFIKTLQQCNITSEDLRVPPKRGENSCNWKGNKVSDYQKRNRARYFLRWSKRCDRCRKLRKILDVIYKDGDENNLKAENIVKYCRRCRMEKDGTLEKIINFNHKRLGKTSPPKECIICNNLKQVLRKGRCHTCSEFFRKNGIERSEKDRLKEIKYNEISSRICSVCGVAGAPAKGKCHLCYEFFRRNKFERSELLSMNYISEDLELLKSLIGKTTLEKAKLIRKIYATGKYSQKFLAENAYMSVSNLNDIIRGITFKDSEYEFKKKYFKKAP